MVKAGFIYRYLLLFFGLFLVSFVLLFNVLFIPRGVHLAVALLEKTKIETNDSVINSLTNRWVAMFIFKHTGELCDAPYYKEGRLVSGKNKAIYMAMFSINEEGADRKKAEGIFEYIALRCDVNVLGQQEPLPPLHTAVLFRNLFAVKKLLSNGADISKKINRPQRNIDQMNALKLAEYLESKASTPEFRDEYAVIVNMLRHHDNKSVIAN